RDSCVLRCRGHALAHHAGETAGACRDCVHHDGESAEKPVRGIRGRATVSPALQALCPISASPFQAVCGAFTGHLPARRAWQPHLFDAQEFPLFFAPEQADDAPAESDECPCATCTGTALDAVCARTGAHPDYPFQSTRGAFNHCTLDGMPARIIGRSFHYAII